MRAFVIATPLVLLSGCLSARKRVHALESEYDDPNVADCGWTEINAHTQRGDKTVRGRCNAAPKAFDESKAAFFNGAERARISKNISE